MKGGFDRIQGIPAEEWKRNKEEEFQEKLRSGEWKDYGDHYGPSKGLYIPSRFKREAEPMSLRITVVLFTKVKEVPTLNVKERLTTTEEALHALADALNFITKQGELLIGVVFCLCVRVCVCVSVCVCVCVLVCVCVC